MKYFSKKVDFEEKDHQTTKKEWKFTQQEMLAHLCTSVSYQNKKHTCINALKMYKVRTPTPSDKRISVAMSKYLPTTPDHVTQQGEPTAPHNCQICTKMTVSSNIQPRSRRGRNEGIEGVCLERGLTFCSELSLHSAYEQKNALTSMCVCKGLSSSTV